MKTLNHILYGLVTILALYPGANFADVELADGTQTGIYLTETDY